MNDQLVKLRASDSYVPQTVHFKKRKFDGHFEIIGRMSDRDYLAIEPRCGQEVVLDVQPDRSKALDVVRFLRGHSNNNGH